MTIHFQFVFVLTVQVIFYILDKHILSSDHRPTTSSTDTTTMDAAIQHLTDRRTYLRLARQIVTNREDNLKRLDDEYRAVRLRILLKIYLSTRQPQYREKRRRLLLRLGHLTKVIYF